MKQKSIRITSAGTAAQQSPKCSWFARYALLLAIPMLSAVFPCQAQITIDSSWKVATDSSIKFSSNYLSTSLSLKDSCWWTKRIDTMQVDFVITVDENNFVKKQKADFMIHKYELKDCKYSANGLYFSPKRNDIFLLDGKPVEVLLYRPKNQYGILVGNSR